MSLPKYLHGGMTGAPSLTYTNGSVNALLLACLVDGFNTQTPTSASSNGSVVSLVYAADPGFEVGSTIAISGATNPLFNGNFRVVTTGTTVTVANTSGPAGSVAGTLSTKYAPLGWSRPYSATNIGVYRQGGTSATKRYWRVKDATHGADSTYYVRGYEAMTAVSTGTGPFPTTAQAAGDGAAIYGADSGASAHAWIIVGTPRFFYFFAGYTDTGGVSLGTLPMNTVYGTFMGELTDTLPGDNYAHTSPANAYGVMAAWYLARPHTGVGTSLTASTHFMGSGTGFGAPAPDPAGNIRFGGPPVAWDSTTIRGTFPGMLGLYNRPIIDGVLLPGAIVTNVTGVSGRVMVARHYYSGSGTDEFGLLLDEDWGDV